MRFDWRALYQAAHRAKNPLQRLALLQEGERIAESAGIEELLFIFRLDISSTCLEINQPELAVASFTWCLHTFDKSPSLSHHLEWILVKLAVVTGLIGDYPQVTLAQQAAILEDYRIRLSQAGHSPRRYLESRSMIASYTGRLQEAFDYRIQSRELPQDPLSNDLAADINSMVFILYQMGKWEAALKEAEPMIKRTLKRTSIYPYTFPMIAKSYLKTGERAKAIEYNALGVSLTEGDLEPVGVIAELLENYALMGLLSTGIDLMERRIGCLSLTRPLRKYRFYASAVLLLKPALEINPDLQLRLPESFLTENDLKDTRAETVLTYFSSQADILGKAFNKRNGNTHWTDYFLQ